MTLTVKDVGEIMKLLAESRFSRLDLEIDGMKLRLARDGAKLPAASPPPAPKPAPAPTPAPAPSKPPPPAAIDRAGLVEVRAPLLGLFYRAPRPGEAPFVEVGSTVTEDTIVGIIEVMKLMTSARAEVRGQIVEILTANGAMVEHGEVLMLVRPES